MNSNSAVAADSAARVNRKQILSLFGLVPLALYVVLHLWTNMKSLESPEVFDAALFANHNSPFFLFLEVFGLGVPLLAHTWLGLFEIARARPNNAAYPLFNNLKFLLQRISAVGVLLFLGAHVVKARLQPAIACINPPRCAETWAGMHEAFHEPLTLTVYVLGLLGISYHLANGLYTASMRWGVVVSDAGRRRALMLSAVCFVVLLVMSFSSLWGFYREI